MSEDMECKHRQVETLVEENKRLKKALEFYADKGNYDRKFTADSWGPVVEVRNDEGEKARRALEKAR
ncbi:hypothetical protein DXT76_13620 [Halobacillus trueperi]|uniref:Uncharacterized protein n=1 Tax=Halobacillus trueperi TaxID=156205 RepID=A0A3D8VLZ3_9BACI|nr:hypothetical protein [Halobacillus trueperi]RDY70307.1 hypothetical protein DXT76_13620 [Halobacillus trueperi]